VRGDGAVRRAPHDPHRQHDLADVVALARGADRAVPPRHHHVVPALGGHREQAGHVRGHEAVRPQADPVHGQELGYRQVARRDRVERWVNRGVDGSVGHPKSPIAACLRAVFATESEPVSGSGLLIVVWMTTCLPPPASRPPVSCWASSWRTRASNSTAHWSLANASSRRDACMMTASASPRAARSASLSLLEIPTARPRLSIWPSSMNTR